MNLKQRSTLVLTLLLTTLMVVGAAQTAPRLTFLMLSNGEKLPDASANPLKQGIDRAVGADLQLELVPTLADYQSTLSLRLGGDNPPDLFQIPNRQSMQTYAAAGLLLDLTSVMDAELKPVTELTGKNALKQATIAGRVWGVASTQNLPQEMYWIRQDWLERLGLNAPKTLSEFTRVARAFTMDDPDGNGKNDTYGITGLGWQAFAPIFGAFGVGTPNSLYVERGTAKSAYLEAEFPRAIDFTRRMVSSGVVDPELWNLKTYPELRTRFYAGRAGIAYIQWPAVARDSQLADLRRLDPNARIAPLSTVLGGGGRGELPNEGGWPWRMWGIPASLKNNPARLKKVLEVLNYVSSATGNRLVKYGVEGRQYTMVNNRPVATELMSAPETAPYYLYQLTGRDEREYFSVRFPNQLPFIEAALRAPRKKDFANFVNLPTGIDKAAMDRFGLEETVKFLTNRRPMSQFPAFVGELKSVYRLESFVSAARTQLDAAGFLNP
jgi:putative aldouronate transport system substrate-binding protein